MGKLNKKQLYANWVCAQYPPNRKSTKINAKYNFVFKLYEKDIDLTKYKTNSKKAILWEHFLHLLKTGNISIENVPAQVHEVSYSKTRKKIIKRAKGKIDVNSFYLTDKWISVRNKAKKLYKSGCMRCKAEGVEIHVDHILPRSQYPMLELDIHNLQILCKKCNLEKSNKESVDYRTDEQRKMCSMKYS